MSSTVDEPVEPDDSEASPYDDLDVKDGVGVHDPDAEILDPYGPDYLDEVDDW